MYQVAILTVSDRCARKEQKDETGNIIANVIQSIPVHIGCQDIVPDDEDTISQKLISYCDDLKMDLVLTNGGTGFSSRDVTPEATLDVVEKKIPGLAEYMRQEGARTTKRAILSRGVCGIRGRSIIINLPGSPKGAKESLEMILDVIIHSLDMVKGKGHLETEKKL